MSALDGVRVVELGMWLAGPAAAGIMADWGADVLKVEPPGGDPMRQLYGRLSGSKETACPPFDTFNRGKRSLAIDLNTGAGRSALIRVIAGADVFVTNMRAAFLQRAGLDPASLLEANPRLVYASLTGYGPAGPDKDAPGFDVAAFTARSGIGERLQQAGSPPVSLPGGMGDVISGTALVAGILGALYHRERTGIGQVVTTSLLRNGVYSIAMDVSARVGLGRVAPVKSREQAPNPLMNCYRAGDDRWFWLVGAESERHWPRLVACLPDESLAADPRFTTPRDRRRNGPELVAILDGVFAEHTRDEWAAAFAEHDVWWAPVNAVDDLLSDPQVVASGAFGDGGPGAEVVASPVDFSATPIRVRPYAPAVGAETAEILSEAGLPADEVAGLREAGIIPDDHG